MSSQLIMGQVTTEHYQDEIENITLHTGRLCPNVTDDDTGSIHSASTLHHHAAYTTATRITGDKEYPLHTTQLRLTHNLHCGPCDGRLGVHCVAAKFTCSAVIDWLFEGVAQDSVTVV